MTEQPTCQICHTNPPREGRSICGVCMGLDDVDAGKPVKQVIEIDPTAKPIGVCSTCGEYFEPYKIGANFIRSGICHSCVMKKKYGQDWQPGGNVKARHAKAKAKRDAARARLHPDNGGPKHDQPEQTETNPVAPPTENPGCHRLTLTFEGPDREMYMELIRMSTKERRTLEQQVLYLLDGAMEQP